MRERIENSSSFIGVKERKALNAVLKSNFLAEGPQTEKFEREFAEYIGCRFAIAVSSGTTALHCALIALGVGVGDEVLAPNYTCRSILNAVQYANAKPVLCDVDKRTFNILPQEACKKKTSRTKAVIIAHMFGCPASVKEFRKIGVPIIEDCAQSIGAEYNGKLAGSFADMAIFSFEGTKTITTGEGGMVTTNSARLKKRFDAIKEPYGKDFMPKYTYRMSDLQAAVGCVQIKRLPEFIRRREQIARQYMNAFGNDERVQLPFIPKGARHTFHRFILTLKEPNLDQCLRKCQKKGVMVKRAIKPYVLNQYLNISDRAFPNTQYIMKHCASVPIYPALKNQDVKKVIDALKGAL
ncbi:MAG: DegT/DnrJ/EryC1/StrS family aminotransferase [Candidatus Omnitrophica bacterium]|nr:DegT/DnrJ/EryC1/StrS family aminotransferase [Candidatus Omnitrophota bacterium]